MKRKIFIPLAIMAFPISLLAQTKPNKTTDSLKMIALQEVQVTATRASKKTPMSYSNISHKEISKVNLGQDIPYLLTMTPSLVSSSDAGTGIGYTGMRIRGADATRINVMIDGVPLNDSESQGVFWVDIPDLASSLQDIQIQRGVGTSSNGAAAFGASVNLQTMYLSQKASATASISGGSYGAFRREAKVSTGRLGGHWAMDARLSRITNDGYIDRSGVKLNSFFVQGGYFDDKTVIKLMAFGGTEVTGIAWNGISPENMVKYGRRYNASGLMNPKSPAPIYYNNTDNYDMKHYHLVINRTIGRGWNLNVTFHRTDGFGFTHEYRTGKKLKDFGLAPYTNATTGKPVKKFNLVRRKYLDNTFNGIIASLNYRSQRLSVDMGLSGNYYKGLHYGEIRWSDYPTPYPPNKHYYDNTGKKQDISAYVKANYQILRGLSIFGDLQYRDIVYSIDGVNDSYYDGDNGLFKLNVQQKFHFFNPKGGLFYQVNRNNAAYASVSVGHREPDRSSYQQLNPNEYPKAESLIDYELGYKYTSTVFSFGANLYYMDYVNQLVPTGKYSDVGGALLTNVPNSYRIGLETTLAWKIFDHLRYDMSLALSRNKIKNYTYYEYNSDYSQYVKRDFKNVDIAYSPNIVTAHRLTFEYGGFDASATFKYIGKQYLDNTETDGRSIPAYNFTNLRFGYDIPVKSLKKLNLSLMVNNVFNQMYLNNGWVYDNTIDPKTGAEWNDIRVFPQAGINVLVGATITL